MEIEEVAKKLNVNIGSLQNRMDGRIEWVCSHGCGHTVFAPKVKQSDGSYYENYLHGCCGCCRIFLSRNYIGHEYSDGCCKDMKRVKP